MRVSIGPMLPRLAAAALTFVAAAPAGAQCLPVTGCSSPALAVFDNTIANFMCQRGIGAGSFAMTRDGVLIHARAFGWADQARTIPLETDALMRIASVSKPITASAVRELIADGRFTLNSFVFDLGQPGGGLLDLEPFPSLGDPRLADITVAHLLNHTGGWNRDIVGDLTYREVIIASAMGVPSPPGRINTVRYILGQPLQHTPGTTSAYSNIGCLVLGLIIEQERNRSLETVLDAILADAGVASGDHIMGRTFFADRHPREPYYEHPGFGVNVFDPAGPAVNQPYGTWDHEARTGQGGQLATASALAMFATRHYVNGSNIGALRPPNDGGAWLWNHTGSLPGTQSLIRQRGDGITYAIIFNSNADSYSSQIRTVIDGIINTTTIDWPVAAPFCCSPDLNGDGVVSASDLAALLGAWGAAGGPSDINDDGVVNALDLAAMLGAWGPC